MNLVGRSGKSRALEEARLSYFQAHTLSHEGPFRITFGPLTLTSVPRAGGPWSANECAACQAWAWPIAFPVIPRVSWEACPRPLHDTAPAATGASPRGIGGEAWEEGWLLSTRLGHAPHSAPRHAPPSSLGHFSVLSVLYRTEEDLAFTWLPWQASGTRPGRPCGSGGCRPVLVALLLSRLSGSTWRLPGLRTSPVGRHHFVLPAS